MSRVDNAESPILGTGVFSSAHFSPGEIIRQIDDPRVVTDTDPLDPAKRPGFPGDRLGTGPNRFNPGSS
jgi:hypothetical protein